MWGVRLNKLGAKLVGQKLKLETLLHMHQNTFDFLFHKMNMRNISIAVEIVRHLLDKSQQQEVLRRLLTMHNEIHWKICTMID